MKPPAKKAPPKKRNLAAKALRDPLFRPKVMDNPNAYKRRVDVIDGLRQSQTGPVNLMAMMGETINNTEAVWLNKLDDQGGSVNLEGTALSTDAVANLIANLQKTGFFKNVEIKETYQDEAIKEMQAFQFTLTCEKGKS